MAPLTCRCLDGASLKIMSGHYKVGYFLKTTRTYSQYRNSTVYHIFFSICRYVHLKGCFFIVFLSKTSVLGGAHMSTTSLQDSKQPLPQDICEALMKKKRAHAGLLTKRQLLFGSHK